MSTKWIIISMSVLLLLFLGLGFFGKHYNCDNQGNCHYNYFELAGLSQKDCRGSCKKVESNQNSAIQKVDIIKPKDKYDCDINTKQCISSPTGNYETLQSCNDKCYKTRIETRFVPIIRDRPVFFPPHRYSYPHYPPPPPPPPPLPPPPPPPLPPPLPPPPPPPPPATIEPFRIAQYYC